MVVVFILCALFFALRHRGGDSFHFRRDGKRDVVFRRPVCGANYHLHTDLQEIGG